MDGIESIALFEEKVSLTPRDLANQKLNIHGSLIAKLSDKMEGTCSLHGWVIPDTLKLLSRSMGYLESGRFTGDLVFHVQVQAKVLNPPSGSHLVGEVVGNNMMGMYVSYKVPMKEVNKKTKQVETIMTDAIKIILPRDLHIGDEEFSKVQIGEKVRLEIKKSRFQVNDKYILSVGVFEGKVGSDYVAPAVEEVEEVPAAVLGPGAEAAARIEQFEKEQAEREKATRLERPPEYAPPQEESKEEVPLQQLGSAPTLDVVSGDPIYFNAAKIDTYKELDNRFPAKFTLDGKEWPSVEHYYQAMKFPELPDYQEVIRTTKTSTAAAKLGKTRDPTKPIRADWQEQRGLIMRKAIFAKFDQNPPLKEIIVGTGIRPLIFADANDAFWGYGRTKMGQNRLGILLMQYRGSVSGLTALDG